MRKLLLIALLVISTMLQAKTKPINYVIAASNDVVNDSKWSTVVNELRLLHPQAIVIHYQDSLRELLPSLQELRPRYLAVVDKPENINRDFVIDGNRMSRSLDEDIYEDYIWGIITGYSADDALRIIHQSADSLILKTALSSITETSSGQWFDRFAWIDDQDRGKWGEKKNPLDPIDIYKTEDLRDLLSIFHEKWEEIDPDVIITASHATQNNLEMPYSIGNVISKDGQLYAKYDDSEVLEAIGATNKPRVYLPIGNCLIGDMNNSSQSMAAAFLSSGGATAMLGYVVPTWFGRNGWGALKYFLSNPGKHTLAEAAFLNRQDMLTQEYRKNPGYLEIEGDFETYGDTTRNDIFNKMIKQLKPKNLTMDDIGFAFDRDVVVYYGDPAWDVRSQSVEVDSGYDIKFNKKGSRYVVTLKTNTTFSIDNVKGKGFKEEHVKDIPLSYFFSERIFNPIVVKNKSGLDIAFDENFLLIYNQNLEPNKSYEIVFKSEKS